MILETHPGIEDDQWKTQDPGEVTQVSRITEVHPKVQVKSPVYRGSRFCAPGTRQNRGGQFIAYVPREVTQV